MQTGVAALSNQSQSGLQTMQKGSQNHFDYHREREKTKISSRQALGSRARQIYAYKYKETKNQQKKHKNKKSDTADHPPNLPWLQQLQYPIPTPVEAVFKDPRMECEDGPACVACRVAESLCLKPDGEDSDGVKKAAEGGRSAVAHPRTHADDPCAEEDAAGANA